MRRLIALAALLAPAAAQADVYPVPGTDTPRVQEVRWTALERVVLTALPQSALTVMLEPGEEIRRVTLGDERSWEVRVSAELDGFTVLPRPVATDTSLRVETGTRAYDFALQTGTGLMAAYLVRFRFDPPAEGLSEPVAAAQSERRWSYRLRGDRSVRPAAISDDGVKTVITYAEGQALPAVFAIGPSGAEEVVDGYMREGRFVIDRVHEELVFRIDKDRASARRQAQGDERS